jgi:hypothetical protein
MKKLAGFHTIPALFSLMFFLGSSEDAQAQDCSSVLVLDTMNKTDLSIQNLAIAYSVSEGQWEQLQHNLGLDAVIYGIPIGASYADFQNNVRTMSQAYSVTDFKEYSESYASSQLDPSSVEAYKYCLASQFGLAIFVADIGTTADSSYGIWIVNTPFPNGQPNVPGSIQTMDNFRKDSAALLHNAIDKQNFALGANEQLLVYPDDPKKPASLAVSVGNGYSRTLKLPPLVVPKAVTDTNDYSPKISVCAGYCGGACRDHSSDGICYHPKHEGAVFVPGTAHIVKTVTSSGDASITSTDSKSICITVKTDNTSGCVNSSGATAYINASETYPSDINPPSHFHSTPLPPQQ